MIKKAVLWEEKGVYYLCGGQITVVSCQKTDDSC
nr:MAG TPA: hypothetical protein [Caudoviricetes sp.]